MTAKLERKYALRRLESGDYVLLGNTELHVFRIRRYTDGRSAGRDFADRTFWECDRMLRSRSEVERDPWLFDEPDTWDTLSSGHETRREAVQECLEWEAGQTARASRPEPHSEGLGVGAAMAAAYSAPSAAPTQVPPAPLQGSGGVAAAEKGQRSPGQRSRELAAESARAALQQLEAAGGLVGVSELADRWMVSEQRVRQLVAVDGFPAPVARAGRAALWLAAEVELWRSAEQERPGRPGPRPRAARDDRRAH